MRSGREERMKSEEGEKKNSETNEGGEGAELRQHLPEIMKQSKIYKCSRCHFHYLIYSQLRRPNNANEFWCLLTLTTGDNFGIQLRPSA